MRPKPSKKKSPRAYANWVADQLQDWDPSEDHAMGHWDGNVWVHLSDAPLHRPSIDGTRGEETKLIQEVLFGDRKLDHDPKAD